MDNSIRFGKRQHLKSRPRLRPLALTLSALWFAAIQPQAWAQSFAPVIKLAELNGGTGFRLDGVAASDRTGFSVSSAGDVNGDGLSLIHI